MNEGITATELSGLLAPPVLLSLGLALISAQMLIGWVLWVLPIPGGGTAAIKTKRPFEGTTYRSMSRVRDFGRILIEDAFVNTFVITIFCVPNLVMSLAGELLGGSADAAYENLYAFLGIGCCAGGNTSAACSARVGMCGIPTGAGLLAQLLAGYRYAFWYFVGMVLVFVFTVVAVTVIKNLIPLWNPISAVIRTVVEFASGMFTDFAVISTAMSLFVLVPMLVFIPFAVYLLYCLYFLAKFIQLVWPALLFLGGFLYGLPARLGRKWGAVFISATLVLYIGLPIMPIFVNSLTSTQAAEANLTDFERDYDKVLYYLLQSGGTDVTFRVMPREYGPGGDPYMAAPDFARIQISGGGAPDRYIWTDGNGAREYFLAPGTYTIEAVWWHGVPVTFNGTQTTFTITEDDIKAGRPGMKILTLTADVYSFRFSTNGNNGTVFFPVGFRLWGNTWYNARVYSMELTQRSVSFTFWSDCYIVSTYVFEMFVQSNVAYTDLLDGSPPGAGMKWEVKTPYYAASMWSDGALYKYYGVATGFSGGYHTFKMTVNSIGSPPQTPTMEDEDPYSLNNLQNPLLPKPNEDQARSLGQYYASILMLPNVYVYVILVGLSAGIARIIKGRELI